MQVLKPRASISVIYGASLQSEGLTDMESTAMIHLHVQVDAEVNLEIRGGFIALPKSQTLNRPAAEANDNGQIEYLDDCSALVDGE